MAIVATARDAAAFTRDVVSPSAFAWQGYTIAFSPTPLPVEAAWRRLEGYETASVFQSFDYVQAWLRTAASATGEEPVFVTATRDGDVAFLLPMAVVRTMGVRALVWLGQSHSNYGMGLLHPDALDAAVREDWDVDAFLSEIARRVGADLVHLDNQPAAWAGRVNPFAACRRAMRTANDTFVVRLEDDFAAHYKKLYSSRTLSGLKRKQRKLEELGKVVFARPVAPDQRRDVLAWFFACKSTQLAQAGAWSPFDAAEIQALYRELSQSPQDFVVDELTVDGTRVAMGMTARAGRTAYLLNTVHQGDKYARCSPGALLLHRMVADAHAAGARVYDFGPGALPYKLEWEPAVVPLMASTHLVRAGGFPAYAALVIGGLLKAKVKRHPRLLALALRVRALTGKT